MIERICTAKDTDPVEPKMVPNRPSPEGRALGKEVARLADSRTKFPNMRERCKTCAFRGGTIPNGCVATLMDAMKAVMEMREFLCHEKPAGQEPDKICAGWFIALASLPINAKPTEAPWPWSCEGDEGIPADETYCDELKAQGHA